MDNEQRAPINLGGGVGIIGTSSFTISEGEDSKLITIERRGSMVHNVIPSVIVVCEDSLAETILGMVAGEMDGSFKVIAAGAWDNMPTLLYGIYFYRDQVRAAGDKRHLEVVCVMDGDIRYKDFKKGLDKVHSGNHVPEDIKKALARIEENLVEFQLVESKPIGGLPEYHHQLWLEEITDEVIDGFHEAVLKKYKSNLDSAEGGHISGAALQIKLLQIEIAEAKRIINSSREIAFHTLRDDKDKVDCHSYYTELKKKLLIGDTLIKYPAHQLEYNVLSIIRKYNPGRWQAYIAPVKKAMREAFQRHVAMFKSDRFNLTELGDGK